MPTHCLFTLGLALVLSTQAAAQTIVYVKPVATGAGTGTSWADATDDLAGEMATATPNTEIWVQQGTYVPTVCAAGCTDAERNASFQLRPGVTVAGGFVGTETNRLQASSSNTTVLSGDIGVMGDATDNSYNVVLCADCGTDAGLENFTVSGAYGDRAASSSNGERGRSGGGLFLDGRGGAANPVVTSCTFANNFVIGQGGAVSTAAFGGQASPVFRFCLFDANSSNGEGGAVAFSGFGGTANPKFEDCAFVNNQTVYSPSTSQAGGAIYLNSGGDNCVADFNRCVIDNNQADPSTTSGMNGNSSGNGGALYANGGGNLVVTFNNSTLSNNSAYSAGAVYVLGGTANFTNVTVIGNRALGSAGSGGGIYTNNGVSNIYNAILSDNVVVNNPNAGGELRFVNGTVNIDYSIVQAANSGQLFSRASTNNTDILAAGTNVQYAADAQLSRSGNVYVITSPTSPAINAGDNARAVTQNGDNVGSPRIQQSTVDLGAVESSFAPLPVELVSFSATVVKASVRLAWTVDREIDLSGYRLERSSANREFKEVNFIPAMGEGSYAYEDRAVLTGETYYYRLVSLDLDGGSETSHLVAASLSDEATSADIVDRIYPNPTAGQLVIEIAPGQQARTIYATVLDERGTKLRLFPLVTDGRHELDLSDLPAGKYVISVTAGEAIQTLRFVKG